MSGPRRVGVLGTLVYDRIWTLADRAAGRPFESWGGMAYGFASAAAFVPPGWEVVPLVKVGADLAGEARALLATLPGLRAGDGVVGVPEPTNRVELTYTDALNRGERLTGGVPGWSWDELAPRLRGLDALLVNFISGFEMELETAERLRASFAGPTWCDLHSLFLGPPCDGNRPHRRLPHADRWLACWDAVQTNEDELRLLSPEDATPHPADLLSRGPLAAFTTLGPRGAAWAARDDLSAHPLSWPARRGTSVPDAVRGHAPPPAAPRGDPTGAGDVWGAAAFLSLLGGATLAEAARRANAASSAKLAWRGASDLYPRLAAARADLDAGR